MFELVEQRLRDNTFAIIANNNSRGPVEHRLDRVQQPPGEPSIKSITRLAVDADHLLLMSYDARFETGGTVGIGEQAATTNVVLVQQPFELVRGMIASDDAEKLGCDMECGEISGHVGRAARHKILPLEVHHRHRGFGGNACHTSPNEMVEHDIADDQNAGALRASQDLADARRT